MSVLFNGMLLASGAAAAGITFVASEVATPVTGVTFTVNKPAGVQVGDLLLLGIFGPMTSNTTPAGWTLVSSDYVAGNGDRHVIYSKVADGSEGSTLSVTGVNVSKSGFAMAFRGASTVGTVGTSARAGSTATGTATSISPAAPGVLIGVFCNNGGVRTVSTPPSGMTSRAYMGTGVTFAVYDLNPSPSGATGSKAIVWSATGGVMSLLLQIN